MFLWCLRHLSSTDAANAVLGDAMEDLALRKAEGRAPRYEDAFVRWQLLRAIVVTLLDAVPRLLRAAGLVLRDSARSLRTAPAQSLFIIIVLTVGVTAGTVTFSVVDAVILRPLPIEEPEQLVMFGRYDDTRKQRITAEVYWRLQEQLTSVQGMTAISRRTGGVSTLRGVSSEWPVTITSAATFDILHQRASLGRLWTIEEETRGDTDVAVLSHWLWKEQFNRDPAILGEVVHAGTRTYRVIGVMAAETDFPEIPLTSPGFWIPMAVPRTGEAGIFAVMARMRPGVGPAQVAEQLRTIEGGTGWHPVVTRLGYSYVEPLRRWMLLALGAAALVVLVACVNAANLMLSRCAARAQEIAVRASLGASRMRIVLTVLLEGGLLSAIATAAALVCSLAGVKVARTVIMNLPYGMFRAETIAVNSRVLLAAVAATVVTGLVVALVPAWQTARAPLASLLKDAAGTTSTGRRRWRSVFLTSEVAIVVVLLVVSSLFVVSLVRVFSVDLGINRANLVAVKVTREFRGDAAEIQEVIAHVPGVTGVAMSMGASLPLIGRAYDGAWWDTSVRIADAELSGASAVKVLDYRVSPSYFDVAGLKFLRGGTWSEPSPTDAPSAVIDERVARALFGDADPRGRLLRRTDPDRVYTISGVVPFVPVEGPESPYLPSVYFPHDTFPKRAYVELFVRTTPPADQMVPVIAEALTSRAPAQHKPFVFAADEAMQRITATRRFNAGLMSAFGLVGVLIGAAGVYAVMAAFVGQQTREIGVRLALGATPDRIRRGVLALAARHMAAGFVIGVPIAWWLSRGFTALLFQVTPADVSIYVGVAVILAAIGLVAAWIPARRASRVDPIISLRSA